jgi:3-methyladenine DNA glycosylase AlkD
MAADQSLIADVRRALAEAGDADKAAGMQRYLKSRLPCYGVLTPTLVRIWREVFGAHPLPDRETWHDTVLALWDDAAYREERYAAMGLAGHRLYMPYQDPTTLPLYDHLVVTGAWWDLVDSLATKRIGPLVRAFPGELVPVMYKWARDDDLWRRRTAVIHQVGAKRKTDADLLADCLEPNLDRPEFFLRKAIGWALRDYARTDPSWVSAYVDTHNERLSPLSRREAMKNIN